MMSTCRPQVNSRFHVIHPSIGPKNVMLVTTTYEVETSYNWKCNIFINFGAKKFTIENTQKKETFDVWML
jgi:hypothetical protein